jgi:hypothetical protein
MSLFVLELILPPLFAENLDTNCVGDSDQIFHKKVIDNWSLLVKANHNIDI